MIQERLRRIFNLLFGHREHPYAFPGRRLSIVNISRISWDNDGIQFYPRTPAVRGVYERHGIVVGHDGPSDLLADEVELDGVPCHGLDRGPGQTAIRALLQSTGLAPM
jgi:hypothetical protein